MESAPEPYVPRVPTARERLCEGPLGWLGCAGLFAGPAIAGAVYGFPGAAAAWATANLYVGLIQEDIATNLGGNLVVSGMSGALGLAGSLFGPWGAVVGAAIPTGLGFIIGTVMKGTRGRYL